MRTFSIEKTITTSLSLTKNERRALWDAIAKPLLGFVPAFIFYIAVYVYLIPVEQIAAGEEADPAVIDPWQFGLVMLAALPMLVPAFAMIMNWQIFVMTGQSYKEAAEGVWWERFKSYLLMVLKFFGVFLVAEVLIIGLIYLAATFSPAIFGVIMLLLFVGIIFLMPFVSRLHLIFPALAAGLPETNVANVLTLTKGMGWKIFFTLWLAQFAVMLIFMGVLIVTLIVGLIFSAVSAYVGGLISGLLFIVAYAVFALVIIGVSGGAPALIIMQLHDDLHERWRSLIGESDNSTKPPAGDLTP